MFPRSASTDRRAGERLRSIDSLLVSTRAAIAAADRLVVKVGSSSLTGPDGGLDAGRLLALVNVLAARRHTGTSVVLVSSGAIAAGLAPLGLVRRPRDLATQQAAASVGQGALVAAYQHAFGAHDLTVGQVLLTADDVTRRTHYANARRTLERLLALGVVPVINENDTVATHEIRFGDNDRLAALVAHLINADALVLLSDVEPSTTGRPTGRAAVASRRSVARPTSPSVVVKGSASNVGTGGMGTKLEAAGIATAAGVATLLTSAGRVREGLAGEDVGTLFTPTGSRRASRLLWLAHATEPRGRVLLDAGAVRAVVDRRKSLLPAGITAVEGRFDEGDPIDVCTPEGEPVARGLVNYSSDELPGMLGRTTHDLARDLGPQYEREVIHRDAMVLLGQ